MQPAKYLKCLAENGMSMAIVSRIGFTVVQRLYCRKGILFINEIGNFVEDCRTCIYICLFQLSKAFHAAFTARSTSSFVASAHVESFSPVAGLYVVKVPPSEASCHFPPIKS